MSLEEGVKIRSANINLLRFICAILVIICHASAVAENDTDILSKWLGNQANLGGVAVAVFFFLSGLYVSKSISNSNNIKDYFIKRCKRIFPQLWIVVLSCTFVIGPLVTNLSALQYFKSSETYKYLFNMFLIPVHNLPGVFINHYYTTVNGPLWTMPIEFMCYIVLAVIFFGQVHTHIGKRGPTYFAITTLAYFIYLIIVILVKNEFLITVCRPIICFFVGMTAYEYRDKIKLSPILGIVSLIILFLLKVNPIFNLFMVFVIPYAVCSIALGMPQIPAKGKLFNCSYEMYLLGWPIQQLLINGMGRMSAIMNWVIAVPIDIIIGFCLYELTEMILNKMK